MLLIVCEDNGELSLSATLHFASSLLVPYARSGPPEPHHAVINATRRMDGQPTVPLSNGYRSR